MTATSGDQARYLLVSELALNISHATNIESLKENVLPKLKYVLDFERCGLALRNDDPASYSLRTLMEIRSNSPWMNEECVALDVGIYGDVIRSGEPTLVSTASSDEPPPAKAVADAALENGSLRAIMCLPLQAGGETFGSIAFGSNAVPQFARADVHFASLIAMHLALAIDRWNMIENLSVVGQQLADLNVTLEERVRQTTVELRDQAQILESILNSMGDGVVVADQHGKFLLFNPAAKEIIGMGATDTPTAEWPKTYGAFRVDGVTPFPADELPLVRALRGEAANDVELFMRNKQLPEGVYVSASARPLNDGQGNPTGGVVVFHDVTERKVAEEKIRTFNAELERRVAERTAQLEDLNQELEAFTYSVSHDLKAPLRHLSGFTRLLLEETSGTESGEVQRCAQIIADSAHRMAKLIDDLLGFSRTARAELHVTCVDLNALIAEVRKDFAAEERQRDIEWTLNTLPRVQGDRSLIRLVLVNLLSNALKFTRGRTPARIEVASVPSDNEASTILRIRDNGVGFDEKYAGKMFGVFQRLHSDTEFEGTGIGLANVERIVRRHGGKIWAEGAVNVGASLFVSLPRWTQD